MILTQSGKEGVPYLAVRSIINLLTMWRKDTSFFKSLDAI
jgi:hypothetical protein